MRHFLAVSALLFVAGIANFRLSFFVAYFVMPGVNLVAIGTGDIINLVRTAGPLVTFGIFFVARQTSRHTLYHGCCSIFSKGAIGGWSLFDAFWLFDVVHALAMAIGTGGSTAVATDAVFRFGYGQHGRVQREHRLDVHTGVVHLVMATGTGCIAFQDQILGHGRCQYRRLDGVCGISRAA